MSDFLYACIQLMHNVGAAAVVGSPAVAWWLLRAMPAELPRPVATEPVLHRLAWLTIFAWTTQIVSGGGFGATTYYLKHELPDLTGVALVALVIKVACAIICTALALLYLRTASRWSAPIRLRAWQTLFVLGLTALMSAAILRWYG